MSNDLLQEEAMQSNNEQQTNDVSQIYSPKRKRGQRSEIKYFRFLPETFGNVWTSCLTVRYDRKMLYFDHILYFGIMAKTRGLKSYKPRKCGLKGKRPCPGQILLGEIRPACLHVKYDKILLF
jgi:hypothetical protein